jgi:hypothetical protein
LAPPYFLISLTFFTKKRQTADKVSLLCTSYQPTFVVAVKASTPKQLSDNEMTGKNNKTLTITGIELQTFHVLLNCPLPPQVNPLVV